MGEPHLFTSESVTEGHPDKVADQISDAVLDAMLEQDPTSRVACETMLGFGLAIVAGEVTSQAHVNIRELVRSVICDIGYTNVRFGMDGNSCAVLEAIGRQSPDIAMGVDTGGAGDQGMMFGYASNETPELMPLPILLAHRITRRLAEVRHDKTLPYLRPDGKAQVTVEYEGAQPKRVTTVVVAAQHEPDVSMETLRKDIIEHVVKPAIPADFLQGEGPKYHINATGRFEEGGPQADCGLTGRKIIVDTYGGVGAHGGGAFSGKDPTKVDRSGSYMARHIAKNVVAAGLADVCELQVAYAIGVNEPVSVLVDCQGGPGIPNAQIARGIREVFDLSPGRIIEQLQLRRPVYRPTAAYGHFGREGNGFTWESTQPAKDLKAAVERL